MTDTPDRTIGGLAPRTSGGQPDLSRLQRRNRTTVPVPILPPQATVTPLARSAVPAVAPEATTAPTTSATDPLQEAAQDRITVYIDRQLRGRARTAYRATAHLEGDRTWSDFIERAIRAEVERRETAHNAGEPYGSSVDKLAPGRTVS